MRYHPATITFFIDPARPLVEPDVEPEDLNACIVGGVDMGLAHALIEFSEGNANSHQRMAAQALYARDEESATAHVERRRIWADLRAEAQHTFRDIARIRAN